MGTSMAAILAVTSGGYVALRAHSHGADPVAVAAAEVRVSHAAVVLEQERQHMILMDAASRTMSVESAPKLAAQPAATVAPATATGGTAAGGTVADAAGGTSAPPPNPGTAQSVAYSLLPSFGFNAASQFPCLDDIWSRESGWRYNAENATSGAYGIPQALPGSKMATAGPDWQTSVSTQVKWGLGYIQGRYGTPCGAWSFWQGHGWY
ncbi:MAG TPA: lytic transglycosylase domain-containing protein [Streptosporangiaceae bacterium]|nr:lytic transglycosylase domain-containing protein [Streptosporangiaceae bacterium]